MTIYFERCIELFIDILQIHISLNITLTTIIIRLLYILKTPVCIWEARSLRVYSDVVSKNVHHILVCVPVESVFHFGADLHNVPRTQNAGYLWHTTPTTSLLELCINYMWAWYIERSGMA